MYVAELDWVISEKTAYFSHWPWSRLAWKCSVRSNKTERFKVWFGAYGEKRRDVALVPWVPSPSACSGSVQCLASYLKHALAYRATMLAYTGIACTEDLFRAVPAFVLPSHWLQKGGIYQSQLLWLLSWDQDEDSRGSLLLPFSVEPLPWFRASPAQTPPHPIISCR